MSGKIPTSGKKKQLMRDKVLAGKLTEQEYADWLKSVEVQPHPWESVLGKRRGRKKQVK